MHTPLTRSRRAARGARGILLPLAGWLLASAGAHAATETIVVINSSSTPTPCPLLALPDAETVTGVRTADGKALPIEPGELGVRILFPMKGFQSEALVVERGGSGKPAPGDWLRRTAHGATGADETLLYEQLADRVLFFGALAVETRAPTRSEMAGTLRLRVEIPGFPADVEFTGPDSGRIVVDAKEEAAFRLLDRLTILALSEFSIPRTVTETSVNPKFSYKRMTYIDAGPDWFFVGPRTRSDPDGPGAYLWCERGRLYSDGKTLHALPGTVIRFQRGEFSPNWYVPGVPAVLRPQGKGRFLGASGDLALEAIDRDGDGTPDFDSDLWRIRSTARPDAAGKESKKSKKGRKKAEAAAVALPPGAEATAGLLRRLAGGGGTLADAGPGWLYAFYPGETKTGRWWFIVRDEEGSKPLSNVAVRALVPMLEKSKDMTKLEMRNAEFRLGPGADDAPLVDPLWEGWSWTGAHWPIWGDAFRYGHFSSAWDFNFKDSSLQLDLDGDGDNDIIYKHSAAAKQSPDGPETPIWNGGAGYWDLWDRVNVLRVRSFDPAEGAVGWVSRPNEPWQGPLWLGSFFKRSALVGWYYQGAALPFEEFMFQIVDQVDEPGNGIIKSPQAEFLMKTTAGTVARMGMGRVNTTDPMKWVAELDPLEEGVLTPLAHRICTFSDAGGLTVRVCSPLLPETWDGTGFGLARKGPWRAAGWLPNTPWKAATLKDVGKLKGVNAVLAPEGLTLRGNEGLYAGKAIVRGRIEQNRDGVDFTLYYSPVFGGLHLRGADIGYDAFPIPDHYIHASRYDKSKWYHADAMEEGSYVGNAFMMYSREGKRYWSPTWLYYFDRDRDGYMDVYLHDGENDGVYERAAWVDKPSGSLLFADGERYASWPEAIEYEEVDYQIGDYDRLEALYVKGFNVDPLPVRTHLASSGAPVEVLRRQRPGGAPRHERTPPLYLAAGASWAVRAAVDAYHGDGVDGTWLDFRPNGLVGLGTSFRQEGAVQTVLGAPWSDATLETADVLIVSRIRRIPGAEEMAALRRWLEGGGTLLLLPRPDEEALIRFEEVFGDAFGLAFDRIRIENRTSIYRYAHMGKDTIHPERFPHPDNRAEHYAAAEEALLDGLGYITFTGFPVRTDGGLTPLLSYRGAAVVATVPVGAGRVVATGTDLPLNRFLVHPRDVEINVDNPVLVDRLAAWLIGSAKRFRVAWGPGSKPGAWSALVSGKGGELTVPRPGPGKTIRVDGRPAETREFGRLARFAVPAGEHTVAVAATPKAGKGKAKARAGKPGKK